VASSDKVESDSLKVVSVVGARPQFVKLAPISAAFNATQHKHLVIHTGQHYDVDLSDVFFSGLRLDDPDFHLGVGSGTHGVQTGALLSSLDPVLDALRPDWVLVYGDTNSTLAAALSAVKQHLKVAHLEAGLRSFNRRMPEEHNRVLTDHAADLLLAPTEQAMHHLIREDLGGRSVLVGDVMVDICLRIRDQVQFDEPHVDLPGGIDAAEPYLVATLHRAENTDDPARLSALIEALADLPLPVALFAHPRLIARALSWGLRLNRGAVRAGRPLPYAELIAAVLGSVGVVTDSGGLQKEALLLRRPCTTLRSETEWTETLSSGWNVLVPNPDRMAVRSWREVATRSAPTADPGSPFGDGVAAQRVVDVLASQLAPAPGLEISQSRSESPQLHRVASTADGNIV
jgi:UDP-N-acetylglucosamine 2-epimerase (non-hydrolysing)